MADVTLVPQDVTR